MATAEHSVAKLLDRELTDTVDTHGAEVRHKMKSQVSFLGIKVLGTDLYFALHINHCHFGKGHLSNMRSHRALHAKDIVEIAITLQRFEETHERGLTLFEQLMSFESIYTPKLLQEIDRRIDG